MFKNRKEGGCICFALTVLSAEYLNMDRRYITVKSRNLQKKSKIMWYDKALFAAMIVLSGALVVILFIFRVLPLLMR
jgi:hypothetical protein